MLLFRSLPVMSFARFAIRVPRAEHQCRLVGFVDEEDDQIASGIRLTRRCVNILSLAVAFLREPESRPVEEDFFSLVLIGMVFRPELLDNIRQPYEAIDSHCDGRIPPCYVA